MRRSGPRRARLLLLTALTLQACGDGRGADHDADHDAPHTDPATADTDAATDPATADADAATDAAQPGPAATLRGPAGYAVIAAPATRTVRLVDARGEALVTFGLDGFQLGHVARLDANASYDPYLLKVPQGARPALDGWYTLSELEVSEATATTLRLRLRFTEDVTATLTFEAAGPGRFAAALVADDAAAAGVVYHRLRPTVTADEGFYGLGERFDAVEHRGRLRAMQLELDTALESGYNEAHVPVPLLISTRGWGLFVEDPHAAVFDVAASDAERVDVIFGAGLDSGAGLRFHVLAAEHPLDITGRYYAITGAPRLPARWALGPLIWRDENDDQAQVEADAEALRDLDLAASGYWIDRPYATAVNTFDFDAPRFPDPQAMIERLNALGLRVGLWHTPYLDEADAATAALRAEAEAGGYYPPTTSLSLNNWGPPIDLTNPEARAWWGALIRRYTDLGVEGFKLDYGEDVVVGAFGVRTAWGFADGSDERTMHALFQRFYHSVYAEVLVDAQGPDGHFLLCRGGTYGDQTNGVIIWPGDLDANLLYHGERGVTRDGETFTAVGGLPAAVIAGSSLGPSGFAFFGSDTGGYRHSPPDRETFTRWFQHTALSPVMQIGTSSNDVAWEFNERNSFDQEMLDWYRHYTRLHLRLFPYLWSYAERLADDGRALQRPLGLAYPELGLHPDDVYLLGDHLLVAPVVRRDVRQRDVPLPPGAWLDWWTGERHDGAQTIVADAPLSTLPLYLQAGGIVPLLRPTIDTLAPTTDPARVDAYATTPGRLYAVIGAGGDGAFTLFDGAALTLTHDAPGPGAATLTTTDGAEFAQGFQVEVLGWMAAPSAVRVDGAALTERADLAALEAADDGWVHVDAPRPGLHVRLGAGAHTVVLTP